MRTRRRIKLCKNKKELFNKKLLAKKVIPRLVTIAMNLIALGPRVILRGAFQLFRSNIWARLISTLIFVSFDLYCFFRKKISTKQLIINLILSATLLTGGMTGWRLGTYSVFAIAAENTLLWIIAGLAGAGVISGLLDSICRKVLRLFLKSDVEDMLDFFNAEFELMAGERNLSEEQMDKLVECIKISDKVCVDCFSKADKKRYARNVLQPYFEQIDST